MNKSLHLCSNKDFLFKTCFLIREENSKEILKKLLKKILSEVLGTEEEKISIKKNLHGKPFVSKPKNNIHFSVSHTQNASALAFSSSPIGIDIEKIRKINFKIVNRFFCKEEQKFFSNQDDKTNAFFKIWTRKEAYVKYLGTGFSSFNTDTFLIKEKIKTFKIEDLFISICKRENNFDINLKTMQTSSLFC